MTLRAPSIGLAMLLLIAPAHVVTAHAQGQGQSGQAGAQGQSGESGQSGQAGAQGQSGESGQRR